MNSPISVTEVKRRLLMQLCCLPLLLCSVSLAAHPFSPVESDPYKGIAAVENPHGHNKRIDHHMAGGLRTIIEQSFPGVSAKKANPGALITASGGGVLTCTAQQIILTGSSPTAGVTFSWSGPNGLSSTLTTVTAILPGDYILTVTNPADGTTSSYTYPLSQNIQTPGATATVSSPLDCSHNTVTLQATTPASGTTFKWLNAAGLVVSTAQNASVSVAGPYTLNVTNPLNGCVSTAAIVLDQNINKPGVSATVPGPLTCTNPTIVLTSESPTVGVSYSWTGPGTFSSNLQNPSVTVQGTYTVTALNPTTGCSSQKNVTVAENKEVPGATASVLNQINCIQGTAALTASSPTSDVQYNWAGPNGFADYVQNPSVEVAGTYHLTITKISSGCTSTSDVDVLQNTTLPTITTSVSGPITCANPQVTLSATSSAIHSTYVWTNSLGIASTAPSFLTSTRGGYTLVVTDTDNGCSKPTTAGVTRNITIPQGVTASVSNALTCTATSATLSGTSSTSTVLYSWTGPGVNTTPSASPALSVTQEGPYVLTVTNTANSCTATAPVTVIRNGTVPQTVNASVSEDLTCVKLNVDLTATTTTSGVSYSWTGPGVVTNPLSAVASVSVPGDYTVTVKDNVNGCTSADVVTVVRNITAPEAVNASVSQDLTCTRLSVDLTATTTTTTGVTYSWGGPGPIIDPATANPSASVPGDYTVTVRDNVNGCISTDVVTVIRNNTAPQAVNATVSQELTCTRLSVDVVATTSTSNVSYSWSGPGPIDNQTSATASVSVPGDYIVTITDNVNGCSSTDVVTVIRNNTAPQAVNATVSQELTCTRLSVDVVATTSTSNVSYSWSGPGPIDNQTSATASVSIPGDYVVTVTDNVNGCTSTDVVTVIRNNTAPGAVNATVSQELTCTRLNVDVTATTTTGNVSYSWSGPGPIDNQTAATASVSIPGDYVVTVTDNVNGCTSTDVVTVIRNNTAPEAVNATVLQELTCTRLNVDVTVTTTTGNVSYSWSGPGPIDNQTSMTASVSIPGDYVVTVTDNVNGCTSTDGITVIRNNTAPEAVNATVLQNLTCTRLNVDVTATTTTGNVSYSWSGPGSIDNQTSATASVSVPGDYTVTVTDNVNGCTATDVVTVIRDITAPGVDATVAGILTCNTNTVTVKANSSVTTLLYSWTGPGGFASSVKEPAVNAAGTYSVVVTNPVNGCTSTDDIAVNENKTEPGINVTLSTSILNCYTPITTMTASSIAGATFIWTGPGNYGSTESIAVTGVPGDYTVVATHPTSGCPSSTNFTILEDRAIPQDVTADVSDVITCAFNTVDLLGASSTSGTLSYNWAGPDDFTSTLQEPEVEAGGVYVLTVTNPLNGCSAETVSVEVLEDKNLPEGVGATVSEQLTCNTTSVTLTGSSTTPGVSYSWTGPGTITSPTSSTTSVNQHGTYILTVKNAANGCQKTAGVTVTSNVSVPQSVVAGTIGSNTITCTHEEVTLNATTPTTGVTYSWTGPFGFVSNDQSPTTDNAGDYEVTVKHVISGCFVKATVTVLENLTVPQAVLVETTGHLNCNAATVTLTGSSSTTGVTYSWTGPGTYTATGAQITVDTPGPYTLSVTHTASGCTETDGIVILQNTTEPENLRIETPNQINCISSSVNLTALSDTPGLIYTWVGPGTFTAIGAVISVGVEGPYTVTATHPESHCTETSQVTVVRNITLPGGSITEDMNTTELTCFTNPLTFTGTIGTTGSSVGATGAWSTTDGSYTLNPLDNMQIIVASPGTYIWTITGTNGCVRVRDKNVTTNFVIPIANATVSETVTCSNTSATITGISSSPSVTYSWTGPEGFTSGQQSPEAPRGGDYTLTLSTSGGCTSAPKTINVPEDKTPPAGVTATPSNILNCQFSAVILTGSSSTAGVTYNWSGPQTITNPNSISVSVSTPGDYTLTVTAPNGCTATSIVTVIRDMTVPQNVTAVASGLITCTNSSITLTASSSPTPGGVTYSWTGNNSYTATGITVSTSATGPYVVTAKHNISACTQAASPVTVASSLGTPAGSITEDMNTTELTCFVNPLTFTGTIGTSGVSVGATGAWSTIGGSYTLNPLDNMQIIVTAPGTYRWTITATNGCVRVRDKNVTTNFVNPTADATVSETITCDNPSAIITGISSSPSVSYSWTGPNTFTSSNQNPEVYAGGDYTLKLTTSGGCTGTKMINVPEDKTPPANVTASTLGHLDCETFTAQLQGSSSTPGVTYQWAAPFGIVINNQNPEVGTPGNYTLTVKRTANGCTQVAPVVIVRDDCEEFASARKITANEQLLTSETEEEFAVNIYPNPVAETGTITFTPGETRYVRVEIFTLTNALVATLYEGEVREGKSYSVTFDTQNYANGVYVYRILHAGKQQKGRLVVAH